MSDAPLGLPGQAGIDSSRATPTGVLVHGVFVGGPPLPSWLGTVDRFPAAEYRKLYEVVSSPLAISGPPAERLLGDGDISELDIHFRGRKWLPETAFGLFHDGWIGVAQRATTMHRAYESFRTHELAQADDDLFDFFIHGCAIFDSFAFATHAAASMLAPAHFKLETSRDLSRVNLGSVVDRFSSHDPQSRLTRLLRELRKRPEFGAMSQLRNVLIHRASPSQYSIVESGDSWWALRGHFGIDLPLTAETLDGFYPWAMSELTILTAAAIEHFEPSIARRLQGDLGKAEPLT